MLNTLRHRLHRWSWIACLAIFGLAFAPTLSRALAHASGDAIFNDICSASASQNASGDLAAHPDSAPAAGLSHMDHCPLCGLGAGGMAAAMPPSPALPPVDLGEHRPTLFLQAPQPLFAWASAQPRAPPVLS